MYIVNCPHCNLLVEIESINCGIFRHAVYKRTNSHIPPHTPKNECDRLFQSGEVWGCAKPFRVTLEQNQINVSICDYI
jgi:hypothetical protein